MSWELAVTALGTINDLSKSFARECGLPKLCVDTSSTEEAIGVHLRTVRTWAADISTRDMGRPRSLDDLFIRLELHTTSGSRKLARSIELRKLLSMKESAVVLGGPGAGKTTMAKYLCATLLSEEPESDSDCINFPLVIRLREYVSGKDSLVDILLSILNLKVGLDSSRDIEDAERASLARVRQQVLATYLDEACAVVILDGLDELPASRMARISEQIADLERHTEVARMIVTCRYGAYQTHIPGFVAFSIASFSDKQLNEFAKKWFQDDVQAAAFMKCLKQTPYADIAKTPLHAANLCLIFEDAEALPKEHTRIYYKIIQIRVREWDRERAIIRKGSYAGFGPDEKYRFLSSIAFEMARIGQGVSFSFESFERAYHILCGEFSLPSSDARGVLEEVEAHTGLGSV